MTEMSLVPAAVTFMIDSAMRGELVTYSDLGAHLGGAEPHALDSLVLGHIRDEVCDANGYPPLTAIVVNKETWRPGNGFWGIWPECRTAEQRDTRWVQMVKDVYAFDLGPVYRQYGGRARHCAGR